MGEDAMAASTTREMTEGRRIEVHWLLRVNPLKVSSNDRNIKAEEVFTSSTRAERAEEVAEARGNAEAEEDVTLIWSKRSSAITVTGRIMAKQDPINGGKEGKGRVHTLRHKGIHEGLGAKGAAKDGVPRGNRRTLATKDGGGSDGKRI